MPTSKNVAAGRAVAGAYPPGSAKRDPATGAIAVRTDVPYASGFIDRLWGVMTLANGGHYQDEDSVLQWADLIDDPAWVAPVFEPETPLEDELPEEDS